MKERTIKIALLGAGTVGGGVYKLLERRKEELPQRIGAKLEIVKILVRDASKQREGFCQELFTENADELLNDPELSVIIEVMGGIEPAKTYLTQALKAGKHVVTANKDLMAAHGKELMDLAAKYGCDLLFEASVAGGVPIIRPLKQCLAANDITEVTGIVNGTTNYILTRMSEDGMDFSEALALAKTLGYAEADPTADICGLDAGRKLAILASVAFHSRVTAQDVDIEGITNITAKEIQYAKEMGCVIKLLGVASRREKGILVRVCPMLLPKQHPIASVKDSYNAIFVHGDAVDDAMFLGRGAGEFPTASAVVGDLMDVGRNILAGCTGRIGCTCYKELPVIRPEETKSKFYLRMQVEDRPGALASIASVFGNNGVSIAKILQKEREQKQAELVVITDQVMEKCLKDSLTIFQGMSLVQEVSAVLRVYGE